MPEKRNEYFLSALKVLMICFGSWIFKAEGGRFHFIYRKFRYSFIVIFSLMGSVFPYTIATDYKCKLEVIENFSYNLHILSASILWKLLESKHTEKFFTIIYNYENERFDDESSKGKEICMKFSKKNNNIVKGLILLASVAAISWFFIGIK